MKVFTYLVNRLDGKEDVLKVFTYLVDADVPFLCGKKDNREMGFENRYKK